MKPQSTPFSQILRLSGIIVMLIAFSIPISAGNSDKSFYNGSIKLNPACKVKRMSNGDVIVLAKDQTGTEVKHQFTDFYADLIMAAYRKQRIAFVVDTFSKKYYLSEDDCRREVKHAVNVLSEWNIIYRDDQVASR